MKQAIYKIVLLIIAIGLIIGAITLMITTASVSAPSEPNLRPVISHYADSLTARYNEGASTADFSRALDFNNLCLRERRIESRVYDRNMRSLVSDSASRAYTKFRRIYDNASSWNYSSLQSALNQMQILEQYKLADGTTAAMDNHGDSCHVALRVIDREYRDGLGLCKKRFEGNVNYENANRIIIAANDFLAEHPKLNTNTEIAEEHRKMKSRLTSSHVNSIKRSIDDMRGMYFPSEESIRNYARTISQSIQNYSDGVTNRVYVRNGESADSLRAELQNNEDEAKMNLGSAF